MARLLDLLWGCPFGLHLGQRVVRNRPRLEHDHGEHNLREENNNDRQPVTWMGPHRIERLARPDEGAEERPERGRFRQFGWGGRSLGHVTPPSSRTRLGWNGKEIATRHPGALDTSTLIEVGARTAEGARRGRSA